MKKRKVKSEVALVGIWKSFVGHDGMNVNEKRERRRARRGQLFFLLFLVYVEGDAIECCAAHFPKAF